MHNKHQPLTFGEKIQQPTQRLYNYNLRNQLKNLGLTNKKSQAINEDDEKIILLQVLKKYELHEIYQDFKKFQADSLQCIKRADINQIEQMCKLLKLKLKPPQVVIDRFNSSISRQTNNYSNIANLLEQLYECRKKIKDFQGDKYNFSQVSKSESQIEEFNHQQAFSKVMLKENINTQNINLKSKQDIKNSSQNLIIKKAQTKKTNNILGFILIYNYYLELKSGFLFVCGLLWKLLSFIMPQQSEQLFLLINNIRKKQMIDKKHRKLTKQAVRQQMQQSNKDILSLKQYSGFLTNKVIIQLQKGQI